MYRVHDARVTVRMHAYMLWCIRYIDAAPSRLYHHPHMASTVDGGDGVGIGMTPMTRYHCVRACLCSAANWTAGLILGKHSTKLVRFRIKQIINNNQPSESEQCLFVKNWRWDICTRMHAAHKDIHSYAHTHIPRHLCLYVADFGKVLLLFRFLEIVSY